MDRLQPSDQSRRICLCTFDDSSFDMSRLHLDLCSGFAVGIAIAIGSTATRNAVVVEEEGYGEPVHQEIIPSLDLFLTICPMLLLSILSSVWVGLGGGGGGVKKEGRRTKEN
jgi:hypothetical protein